MKKLYIAGLVIVAVVALGAVLVPKTMAEKPAKENRSVKIEGATPDNPMVYLGKAFDKKSGKEVEGYAIVHYAKGSGGATKPSSGSSCYGYIVKGAKWKTSESWVVDSVYTGGLDPQFLLNSVTSDISKWESAAGVKMLGAGTSGIVATLPGATANGENEVTFAPIDNAGVIAVTYVWGNFSGPTFNRQIIEWDQIYNTNGITWTSDAAQNPTLMDFNDIATHELGHAVGMGDLYTSSCTEQTMYGYATEGETKKQTLESGDITGVKLLYN